MSDYWHFDWRLFLGSHLLRIDIHVRQPTSKTRMRVIPPDDHLGPTRLLQHVQHLCLKDVIDGFDRDRGSGLRHGKDVDTLPQSNEILLEDEIP